MQRSEPVTIKLSVFDASGMPHAKPERQDGKVGGKAESDMVASYPTICKENWDCW